MIKLGANIHQSDTYNRNLLHFVINVSASTTDSNLEVEQLLLDLGVNVNQRDVLGRVPLHYAFVKIENQNIAT